MGTVINAAAVIIGGMIGMLVKGGLPLRVRDLLMRSLGLCTLFIGISGAISAMMQVDGTRLQANGTLLLICSLGIGAVAGELLRLEDHPLSWHSTFLQTDASDCGGIPSPGLLPPPAPGLSFPSRCCSGPKPFRFLSQISFLSQSPFFRRNPAILYKASLSAERF